MTEEKIEKKAAKEKYVVGEVPTQTAIVIVDTETNTQYNVELALAKILNDLEKILKSLG